MVSTIDAQAIKPNADCKAHAEKKDEQNFILKNHFELLTTIYIYTRIKVCIFYFHK